MVCVASNATGPAPRGRQRVEAVATQQRPFGPRLVTPMYMGAALNPINSSVIATALVSIAAAMGIPVGQTSILISSLYLTSAVAQPTAGRLSEEFGPRRVFLAGVATVLAAGIVGGLARSLAILVLARVLIGLGTSAGYPSAMLLIRRRSTEVGLDSPPHNVLGGLAIAAAATLAIGPAVGGLLRRLVRLAGRVRSQHPRCVPDVRHGAAVDTEGPGTSPGVLRPRGFHAH